MPTDTQKKKNKAPKSNQQTEQNKTQLQLENVL